MPVRRCPSRRGSSCGRRAGTTRRLGERRRRRRSLQEALAPEHRMLVAQGDQTAREVVQRGCALVEVPVVPGELVVLAPAVVVALLRPLESRRRRGSSASPARSTGREEVALLPSPELAHLGVIGRPLDSAVPGAVVVGAVLVVLEVRLVVLLVIGDEVGEREAVVGGDEVDRGKRITSVSLVEVRGPGQP